MTDNLQTWNRFADIDPKFTKAITGKDYGGTSANPQYVIRCLTELFGPVGKGFGWNVLAEDFTQLGDTHLHWCRIRFWWRDGEGVHECEQYGQTKAAYMTSGGKHRVDEDAPKKSLTDAVTKAASQLGIAANIFLGRWDDSKYVEQVNREYREAEKPPAEPAPVASAAEIATAKEAIAGLDDLQAFAAWWGGFVRKARHVAEHPEVIAAKDARKAELSHKEAA